MSEPFIGQISIYGFNFAPRGWAFCNGQILSIAQNTALFSLLGTTYGGNGQTTFALPNLQSRVPIHFGQGPGLSAYSLGEQAGTETVTLTQQEMPQHTHTATTAVARTGSSRFPLNNLPATGPDNNWDPTVFQGTLAPNFITNSLTGGSQPHSNIQPFLALNFCIALEGIFPSRN